MTLTVYDAAMTILVIGGMIWGAWRGVTWQLASIASLVVGYLVAHQVSPRVAADFPGDPVVQRALAMISIYAAVAGGIFLVAWLFRTVLRKMKFEAFDRHLGMLLGGVEGLAVGLMATLFVVSLAPSTRDAIFSSPSGKVVSTIMNTVGPVMPSEARDILAPYLAQAKEAVDTGKQVLPSLLPTGHPTR